MAEMTLSARDRKILFAAAATLPRQGDRVEWDRNLAEYLRLKAVEVADASFGKYYEVSEHNDWIAVQLREKYGANNRGIKEADEARVAAFAPVANHENYRSEHLLDSLWWATAKLIETPAPDVEALLLKVELIPMEAMKDDQRMSRPCIEIIEEDAARLREMIDA